jgi:Mce-associated membrane protein
MTEPDPTDAPDLDDARPASPRGGRTVPVGAFAVAVIVAAALAVLAVFALASESGSGDDGRDREIRLSAGRFAERFLTYEGSDFESWRDEVLELATGGFAEEFAQAESGLRVFFEEGARDAVASVTDVFVGDEDRGTVEVVVSYDRVVSGDEDRFSEQDRYLLLSLIRVDGDWRADNVIDLASSTDLGSQIAPPDAPTTTPSPPTSEGG